MTIQEMCDQLTALQAELIAGSRNPQIAREISDLNIAIARGLDDESGIVT